MKDLINWVRDFVKGWLWGHVYEVFIPIFVVSVVGAFVKALHVVGAPQTNDAEQIKQYETLVYNAINAWGTVGNITSVLSLIAICARLFRDAIAKFFDMLGG